jgi:hypothetical protein
MKDELAEYSYLWDGSSPGWVLVKDPEVSGEFSVVHKTRHVALLIENDAISKAVCQKMLENGCEVLDGLTPGDTLPIPSSI